MEDTSSKSKGKRSEKKPKDGSKMVRSNITIPPEVNVVWDTFCKAHHMTYSQFLRNAAEEYIRNTEKIEHPEIKSDVNQLYLQQIQLMQEQIRKLDEKLSQKPVKEAPEPSEIREREKGRIMKFIEKRGPQTYKDLMEDLEIPREKLKSLLEELTQIEHLLIIEGGHWRIP